LENEVYSESEESSDRINSVNLAFRVRVHTQPHSQVWMIHKIYEGVHGWEPLGRAL
jgi:hypothetical protein